MEGNWILLCIRTEVVAFQMRNVLINQGKQSSCLLFKLSIYSQSGIKQIISPNKSVDALFITHYFLRAQSDVFKLLCLSKTCFSVDVIDTVLTQPLYVKPVEGQQLSLNTTVFKRREAAKSYLPANVCLS